MSLLMRGQVTSVFHVLSANPSKLTVFSLLSAENLKPQSWILSTLPLSCRPHFLVPSETGSLLSLDSMHNASQPLHSGGVPHIWVPLCCPLGAASFGPLRAAGELGCHPVLCSPAFPSLGSTPPTQGSLRTHPPAVGRDPGVPPLSPVFGSLGQMAFPFSSSSKW